MREYTIIFYVRTSAEPSTQKMWGRAPLVEPLWMWAVSGLALEAWVAKADHRSDKSCSDVGHDAGGRDRLCDDGRGLGSSHQLNRGPRAHVNHDVDKTRQLVFSHCFVPGRVSAKCWKIRAPFCVPLKDKKNGTLDLFFLLCVAKY